MIRRGPVLLLMLFAAPLLAVPLRAAAVDVARDDSTADRLVNLDTAATAPKGALAGSVDLRSLVQPEHIIFTSLSGRYGLCPHLEVGVRAVTGTTRALTAGNGSVIAYGGRDTEVYAKYGLSGPRGTRLALLAGASFPATPAQNQATGTVSGVAEMQIVDRVTVYLNPRAVFIKDNTIVGVGVGTSIRVSDRIHLVGDWTGIVSGDNTLSTTDATRKRGDVWGVALRFSTGVDKSRFDLDIGYGNATGSTTGTSLTPGLGNAGGIYVALRARP